MTNNEIAISLIILGIFYSYSVVLFPETLQDKMVDIAKAIIVTGIALFNINANRRS